MLNQLAIAMADYIGNLHDIWCRHVSREPRTPLEFAALLSRRTSARLAQSLILKWDQVSLS